MKVISFSLWGDLPIYTCGAIANARLVGDLYPGWRAVFYLGRSVPNEVSDELERLGSTTIRVEEPEDYMALMWRFRAVIIPGVTTVIFRDTDSRLSVRERSIVKEWQNSGKALHVIRDHPFHTVPILGGMWGCQGASTLRSISDFLTLAGTMEPAYGVDQEFLARHVYPAFARRILVHDSFFRFEDESQRIAEKREAGEFIGERIDCSENFEVAGRQSLIQIQGNPLRLFTTRLIEHSRWRKVWGVKPN